MKSFIEAIREGKISKPLARRIVRRLQKKKITIDPALIELIDL